MANSRKTIRTTLKALLSGQTEAGTNVYTNRDTNFWQSELPAIIIYTTQESAVHESLQGQRYYRTLQLNVEVKVEAASGVDDALDDLIGDIEDIVTANKDISGTVLTTVQLNTETNIDSDGEKYVGTGTISFECKYIA